MTHPIPRAIRVITKANLKPTEVKGTVTLNFQDRFRRRVRMHEDGGQPFLLDLPQATYLNDGDGLVLGSSGILLVRAAFEDVLYVAGNGAGHVARLAWHIGNRHTPVEVMDDGRLCIQYDHVLKHMLEGLGARVTRGQAPFNPETGAYDNQAGAGHGHAHSHHG